MNNKNFEALLNMASKKFGTTPENLRQSLEKGDLSSIMQGMDRNESDKLSQAMSNPDQMKKALSSPEAQALMKKLSGKK